MKVCIVTAFSDCYRLGYFCANQNSLYAQRHKYSFVCETRPAIHMTEAINFAGSRETLSWYKIPLLLREIKSAKYDWVLWIDADAVVVKPKVTVANIVQAAQEAATKRNINSQLDIIIAKDLTKNCAINGGVILVRCSTFAKVELSNLWNQSLAKGATFLQKRFHEQSAIEKMLRRLDPAAFVLEKGVKWHDAGWRLGKHVAVVDNEFLNSNLPSCRFIFHACGDVKRGSKLSVLVEALQNNQEDGREESPDSKMNDFSNFGDLIELLVPRRKFEHVGGKKYNVALSDSGLEKSLSLLLKTPFPYLDLKDCDLTQRSMANLRAVLDKTAVRHLNLGGNQVSIEVLKLKTLKNLDLSRCELCAVDGTDLEIEAIVDLILKSSFAHLDITYIFEGDDRRKLVDKLASSCTGAATVEFDHHPLTCHRLEKQYVYLDRLRKVDKTPPSSSVTRIDLRKLIVYL